MRRSPGVATGRACPTRDNAHNNARPVHATHPATMHCVVYCFGSLFGTLFKKKKKKDPRDLGRHNIY